MCINENVEWGYVCMNIAYEYGPGGKTQAPHTVASSSASEAHLQPCQDAPCLQDPSSQDSDVGTAVSGKWLPVPIGSPEQDMLLKSCCLGLCSKWPQHIYKAVGQLRKVKVPPKW